MSHRRFIFVSWEYPPAFGGGIGTYVAAITRILANLGHTIQVVTVTDRPTPSRELLRTEGLPIEVIRLPIPRAALGSVEPLHTLEVWQARAEQVRACLVGLLREGERAVDAIEFADYRGEGLGFLTSVSPEQRPLSIVRLHTPLVVLHRYNRGRAVGGAGMSGGASVLEGFENDAIVACDRLVSPSRALAREMRELVPALREREIVIHPYPFDAGFAAGARGKEGGSSGQEESGEVLYVGRLEERKGVQCLIEAAHEFLRACPDATLRLVGGDTALSASEPSMLAVLERSIAKDIAARITLTKSMPREQLVALYQSARMCVFPSLFENFPNVCLEAMSLGRPVIGTTNSGMAEMIEQGASGIIVPSGDAGALARGMIDLYRLPRAERDAMGGRAKERVTRLYDPAAIATSFVEVASRNAGALHAAERAADKRSGVGVVIACYNQADYLEETIASVLAQTHPVDAIVLVDDGSTDVKARETIDGIVAKHAGRVRLLRQANGGLARARNAGVAALGTEFFVPLDADDLLVPGFIEKLLATLREEPHLGYAYSWVTNFGAHAGTWKCPPYDGAKLLVENLSVATALVRTRAFEHAGGYNPDMVHGFEDWDFWLALLGHGWHGKLVPEALFLYRKHAQGSMLTRTQQRRPEMIGQMVRHHEGLYAHVLEYAIVEKDRMFFRDHMDLWRLRESIAKATHSALPPPMDQPVGGVASTPAEAQLAFIERSLAWRMVSALKANPLYNAWAKRRWGEQWRMLELRDTPEQRLHRIKHSRSYKLIQAIKATPFYRVFARLRYGGG